MYYPLHPLALSCYRELYGEMKGPIIGYTLDEMGYSEFHTDFHPKDSSIATRIGPVEMNIPILGAAMDTVSGPKMARALSEVGGIAIVFRHHSAETQLRWIEEAVSAKPALVAEPQHLQVKDLIGDVEALYKSTGFSTIPVLKGNKLAGMVFTRDITFAGHKTDPVTRWMMPLKKLKRVSPKTPFKVIRDRLLNEKNCRVLPVIDASGAFHGMYFAKDLRHIEPAWHHGKPLVGMAIGASVEDIKRVREGLKLGVGIIILDSSHGNCEPIVAQAKRVMRIVGNKAAVIAGNIANIDGYIRLAETGVHGIKAGIGSGSICTTSQVTGVGVPMWSVIRELSFAREKLQTQGLNAPVIIADGGVSGPGFAVRALAAGAHAVMAGEWMAAADEAGSPEIPSPRKEIGGIIHNRYRGMASASAIKDRSADRYGPTKSAPEGVDGYVPNKGDLRHWFYKDAELIQGGFAHLGCINLDELHRRGNEPYVWRIFTGAGQRQMAVRVKTDS